MCIRDRYNAALMADMEIVERRNHQFVTSYVGAGRDATVVYGLTDSAPRRFATSVVSPVILLLNVLYLVTVTEATTRREEERRKRGTTRRRAAMPMFVG